MKEAINLIEQLEAARFYGSVEMKFENGKVVHILKTESIRPAAAAQTHRTNGGTTNDRPQR